MNYDFESVRGLAVPDFDFRVYESQSFIAEIERNTIELLLRGPIRRQVVDRVLCKIWAHALRLTEDAL